MSSKNEEATPIERAPKWMWLILVAVAAIVLAVILFGGSSGNGVTKELVAETVSLKTERGLPAYPTITLGYTDTLRILPDKGFYLNLDSDTSGVVMFLNPFVTIQLRPTGPYQFLRKGKEPLVGYPGLEDVKWGVPPSEARFRALGEKCTLLITTKVG